MVCRNYIRYSPTTIEYLTNIPSGATIAAWYLFYIISKKIIMEKMQQLNLMDKILRELEDLNNSQTSVLKKIAQIEADNINLGIPLLEQYLPDLHGEVDSGIEIVSTLLAEFKEHRDKFYDDNKLAAQDSPVN